MKRSLIVLSSAALIFSGGSVTAQSLAARPAPAHRAPTTSAIPAGLHARPVCADIAGQARCMSLLLVDASGRPFTSPAPAGYGPADFQDAYNLPSATKGAGVTVALVDAYDNPNAEADLAVYRSTFGLPACTTANGCFRKVDANGGTNYPRTNSGWGLETSLDLDMVSAICPLCNILLVEANGGWIGGLGKAVNTAVALGAHAVSNSYENRTKDRDMRYAEKFFNHPGVAITVATGDWGYDNFRNFPASSHYVIAVGGTALTRAQNQRGWTETAWSGDGSGCSTWDPKPAWQKDTGCAMRSYADVSADAAPNTGAAVYDTFGYPGWLVVGGTSESSPIIASVFALANDDVQYSSRVYENPGKLYDVVSGSDGTCSPAYLCTAGPGYDGPTGLGTPNGIGDF